MNDAEKVRELLNYSGYPFQHYCVGRISRLDGFQVSAEVPFTYPPTNGPLLGVHGSIDLLAARPSTSGDLLIWFIIECKKANDKIKNWIFLPNHHQHPRWPTFFSSTQEPNGPYNLAVSRAVCFPKLGYTQGSDFDYCINGIEANTALKSANQDKGEKIYNPLKQVVHGTRAFEATAPKIVEGIEYWRDEKYTRSLYVPVVITTANIFVADIPAAEVVQGEIPQGRLGLSGPKQWVSYEFPLPDYLGYTFQRQGGTTVAVNKRTAFVVNDQSIDDFFNAVLNVTNLDGIPKQ